MSWTNMAKRLMEAGAAGLDATPLDFLERADNVLALDGALVSWASTHTIQAERLADDMSTEDWQALVRNRFADRGHWRTFGGGNPLAVFMVVVVFQ